MLIDELSSGSVPGLCTGVSGECGVPDLQQNHWCSVEYMNPSQMSRVRQKISTSVLGRFDGEKHLGGGPNDEGHQLVT